MSRSNELDTVWDWRKIHAAWIGLIMILALASLSLCGCSNTDRAKSAENKAAVAQENLFLAQAAKLMRISDYGREAKYGVSLMPLSADQKAVNEILSLQIALAGAGSLTEQKREAFYAAIAKDDLTAQKLLYQAGQIDAAKDKTIAESADKLNMANAKVKTLLEAGAQLQDHVAHIWEIVYALMALGVVVFVLWLIGKFSGEAATVAAKAAI
jgi:hypothetical protein